MTDIPRSVLDAAYELVRASKNECGPTPEDIARALIARDKRAAEIARSVAKKWVSAYAVVALDVAFAIETYDTPTGQEDGR